MKSIVLSVNDVLSLMLNVMSPPPSMAEVMDERVMEDIEKLSVPLTVMSAVVRGDISPSPPMLRSDTTIVPPLPLKKIPDETVTAKLSSEREPELTSNPVVEESTESVTESLVVPTTENDCVSDTVHFQSSLVKVPCKREMVKDE